jgi:hypothetical protein
MTVDRLPRAARLAAGRQVLEQADAMEAGGALAIERIVSAARSAEYAKVTLTAPSVLARLDADLALRLTPPVDDNDIVHKIGRMPFGLYARATTRTRARRITGRSSRTRRASPASRICTGCTRWSTGGRWLVK